MRLLLPNILAITRARQVLSATPFSRPFKFHFFYEGDRMISI